ncbi:MAG: M14 family zinc carboxypeptidase [Tenacibaculum sp.]
MSLIDLLFLEKEYLNIKEKSLSGRWISYSNLKGIYASFTGLIKCERIGNSEQGLPINKLKIGWGNKKILIWSQMHGNESTGTKAVFDFLNFLNQQPKHPICASVLSKTEIHIIPMLNPDGAQVYTRVNARGIDLNRDAVDLKAKESKILIKALKRLNPDFCFNLHDQRTIFGLEGLNKPATISFLAPSEDKTRKITKGRIKTMNVIAAMNRLLQKAIPNQVGRYSDEFYPTATGDNFQKMGYSTILIEAGHYHEDYEREQVRKFNFYALIQGIFHIAENKNFTTYKEYFSIPNNIKNFYDVIHRSKKNKKDIAYQYTEQIKNNKFVLTLVKKKEGDLSSYLSHKEFKANN